MVRQLRWLACALLLLLGAVDPAGSQCTTPPNGWDPQRQDPPFVEEVTTGTDMGQVDKLQRLQAHGRMSDGALGYESWGIDLRRIKDAAGNPTNDNSWQASAGSRLFDGCNPAGGKPGCAAHGYNYEALNISGWSPGEFRLTERLQSQGAAPGYYRLIITKSGGSFEVIRSYMVEQSPQVTFNLSDQNAQPVNGAMLSVWRVGQGNQPVSVGPTTSGTAFIRLAPGDYQGTVAGSEIDTKNFTFTVVQTGVNTVAIVVNRTGQQTKDEGNLKLIIKDGDAEGKPFLVGASVALLGKVTLSGADGAAVFTAVPSGSYTASVSASGKQTSGVAVSIARGLTRVLTVEMHANGPATVTDTTDDDPSLWEKLVVPKRETLEAWGALIDEFKSWGPFGVVTAFFDSWNHAHRSGVRELVFPLSFQPGGSTYTPWVLTLDLRPQIPAPAPAYADGGRGSFMGDAVAQVRPLLGGLTWIAFLAFLWRIGPRLIG